MDIELKNFKVCDHCYCVGIVDPNCICAYDKYKTIELEFEVCKHCGSLLDDGNPADTPFNKKQIENHSLK
jgi:hypothetical protein